MNKPIIGITAEDRMLNSITGDYSFSCLQANFIKLIESAGGIPLIIPIMKDDGAIKYIIQRIDGLLLTGGNDIHPNNYNEELQIDYSEQFEGAGKAFKRPIIMMPNKDRDYSDIALYKAAKNQKKPILGICRGMQIVNVAEEGTLHQEMAASDINHSFQPSSGIEHHDIFFDKNSFCCKIVGVEKYTVTSLHHQSIKQLGNNLSVAARASDQTIEIIECANNQFIIGIQGHPELTMVDKTIKNRIFDRFIKESC